MGNAAKNALDIQGLLGAIEDATAQVNKGCTNTGALTTAGQQFAQISDSLIQLIASIDGTIGHVTNWRGSAAQSGKGSLQIARSRIEKTSAHMAQLASATQQLATLVGETESGMHGALVSTHSSLLSCDLTNDAEIPILQQTVAKTLDAVDTFTQQRHVMFDRAGSEFSSIALSAHLLPEVTTHTVQTPLQAYKELLHRFGLDGKSPRQAHGKKGRATAWSLSQALAAAIALAEIPRDKAYATAQIKRLLGLLKGYWDPSIGAYRSLPGAANPAFYDDNAWIGLDLVAAYRLTGDHAFLKRAKQVMTFERSGADTHGKGGFHGEYWEDSSGMRTRQTVSTAGAAQLSLELYKVTKNRADLHWGTKAYAWVQHTMQSKGNAHLYIDHLPGRGDTGGDAVVRSYNQGLMIGNGTLLYQLTGKKQYLKNAVDTANASLKEFGSFHSQPPAFNAVFFKNLKNLNAALPTPNVHYAHALTTYANAHTTENSGTLLDQSGHVQTQIYAKTPLSAFKGDRSPV